MMAGVELLFPEFLLAAAALLLPGTYLLHRNAQHCGRLAVATLAVALGATWIQWFGSSTAVPASYFGHLEIDLFSQLFKFAFLAIALGSGIVSLAYLGDLPHRPEFFTLLLTATLGMLIVASATDLLTLFIGLELAAFSSYALVAFQKHDDGSTEAGAKYLLIGAFSSALTLYGISLLYGLTGTLEIAVIAAHGWDDSFSGVLFVAILFIIGGLGFKVAAVPFHAWAPDVYQGAPTPVTVFLATGSKAMGFVALLRIFVTALGPALAEWQLLLAIIAVVTMTVGNLAALRQQDIGRMLAYSSVAQAGYILAAFPVMTELALGGAIFHTLVHAVMKGGAFVVVAAVGMAGLGYTVDSYRGLAQRSPLLALTLTVCLLALVGIPPFGGFFSKFWLFYGIFQAALAGQQWLLWLVVAGVLNSALSLFYYLRVIRNIYTEDPQGDARPFGGHTRYISFAVLLMLALLIPLQYDSILAVCREAAASLL
jgi:NADH-quinone oxidoreductase subunit N